MSGEFAGVGAPSAPVSLSQYKTAVGTPIEMSQAERTANFQSGGSLYQQALAEEKAMRDGVAAMRAQMGGGGTYAAAPTSASNYATSAPQTGGPDPFAGVQTNTAPSTGGPDPFPSQRTGGPDPFVGVQNGGANGNYSNSGVSALSVDPKTMTVAGQLSSVLAADSPLMQQARTRATQAMNARGLSNSSMALGAADSAMYYAALDIAKPDAATYYDASKTNTGYDNQFKMADKTQGFDLAKINAQGEQSRITAKYVADTEAKYKSLTQGSAAATTLLSNMQNRISDVWANDKITDKQKVIDDIRTNTEESLNLIGAMAGDMDLAAYIKLIGGA